MTAPTPPDPMTLIGEAMISMHEIYLSAIAAGFTKDEALTLIVKIACGQARDTGDQQ